MQKAKNKQDNLEEEYSVRTLSHMKSYYNEQQLKQPSIGTKLKDNWDRLWNLETDP